MIRKNLSCICFSLFLAPLALNATGKNPSYEVFEKASTYHPKAIPIRVANSTFYTPLQEGRSLALAKKIAGDADETQVDQVPVDQLDGVSGEGEHDSDLDEDSFQFVRFDRHEESVVPIMQWHAVESFASPEMPEALIKMYTTDDR